MTDDDFGGGFDEKAREGFFAEAEELVAALDRSMAALDALIRQTSGAHHRDRDRAFGAEAELVNEVFRAVHTLKGISSLFNATLMANLSHELEDLLDDLRLGRLALTAAMLDVLTESVDLYARILAASRNKTPEPASLVRAFLEKLGRVVPSRNVGTSAFAKYHLPEQVTSVLTQYEEHRLRANLEAGLSLYWLRTYLLLTTIDSAFDDIKTRCRPVGEIIAYLPADTGSDAEGLGLQILVATRETETGLREATAFMGDITVEEVERRGEDEEDRPENERESEEPTEKDYVGQESPLEKHHAEDATAFAKKGSTPKAARTVRVDIRKLDDLLGIVGELTAVRGIVAKLEARTRADPNMRVLSPDLERLRRIFDRSVSQVQSHVLDVRMVPLSQAFDRLGRVVRQVAREQDKEVNLVVTGADTEIDKLLVEELSDPLMHVVRNAIDHGIEDRSARARANKPAVATIALNAYQKGNRVIIDVEDDGKGMDPSAIAKAAVKRGIVNEADVRAMAAKDLLALVFQPGFTTREEATSHSGRGVGMDVVKTNITKLGGVVEVSSDFGIGTRISLTLPITLAIMSVLVVEVRGRTYCMPLASIEEATMFDPSHVLRTDNPHRNVVTRHGASQDRGVTLPIAWLGDVFELDDDADDQPSDTKPPPSEARLLIAKVADRRVGFVVDRLVGREEIVVKALGRSLQRVRGLVGAAELGDQRLGLVLDAASLIDDVLASP